MYIKRNENVCVYFGKYTFGYRCRKNENEIRKQRFFIFFTRLFLAIFVFIFVFVFKAYANQCD